MGDQASEKFEKRWSMNATEWHWEAHLKRCALEDAALESEAKSLPDKLAEVNQELQELSRKVGMWVCGWVRGVDSKPAGTGGLCF